MAQDGVIFWDAACGKDRAWAFWDYQATVNASSPELPLCFHWSIVGWTPCLLLWLCLPFHAGLLSRLPSVPGRPGKLTIAKLTLSSALYLPLLLGIAKIIADEIMKSYHHKPVVVVTPIVHLATVALSQFIVLFENVKARHTSGVMFVFWLVMVLFDILPFHLLVTRAHELITQSDKVQRINSIILLIIVCIVFAIHIAQFCLCLVADLSVFERPLPSSKRDDKQELVAGEVAPAEEDVPGTSAAKTVRVREPTSETIRDSCPYTKATFLSRITFWWITSLIIKGYKASLTFVDLWHIRIEDKASSINALFEKYFKVKPKIKRKRVVRSVSFQRRSVNVDSVTGDVMEDSHEAIDGDSLPHVSIDDRTTEEKIDAGKSSLFLAYLKLFGPQYGLAGFLKFMYDATTFCQPILLNLLINYVTSTTAYEWQGYVLALLLLLVSFMKSIFVQNFFYNCFVVGMRARTAVTAAVYRKALRLSSGARKGVTVGEIVNLMAVDAQNLQEAMPYLHFIWSAPMIIAVAMILLWQILGVATIYGIVFLIALVPVNAAIGSKTRSLQIEQMHYKDSRVKLMNEVLGGMKVLKLYAWEESFEEKIDQLRAEELKRLKHISYLQATHTALFFLTPFMVSLCAFAAYCLSDPRHVLNANKAFVSLSLFNIINQPITFLPATMTYSVQVLVSMKRIAKFLMDEEVDKTAVSHVPMQESAIKITDGSFRWGFNEPNILTNLNLDVKRGSIIAVVGQVGSGKSSLVNAMLGELKVQSGSVNIDGSIAYVPQQAWIQNKTVRNNILFGLPYKQDKYDGVIDACALTSDFKILPGGDETEVGDKGLNVSGGQKQRISLARAVYQEADIYVLDDPLSAVDSHVGKHIFDKCLGKEGVLKDKTRILVTHGVTYLPSVDYIVVLKGGRVDEMGTYDELISHDGAFAEFIKTYLIEAEEEVDEEEMDENMKTIHQELVKQISVLEDSQEGDGDFVRSLKERRKSRAMTLTRPMTQLEFDKESIKRSIKKSELTTEEVVETGSVSFSVFASYAKANGLFAVILTSISYFMFVIMQVFSNIWLSWWSTDPAEPDGTQNEHEMHIRLGVYGGMGVVQVVFTFGLTLGICYGSLNASRILHSKILSGIMRAPMAFFDVTPLGRIMNRISKDMDIVDVNVPLCLRIWLATVSMVLGTIIIVCYSTPIFIAILVPLAIFYYMIQRLYISTSRQLKRIEAVKRSPIFSAFGESVVGASSIRAYCQQQRFMDIIDDLADRNNMAYFPNIVSYRWLGFWLDMIGNVLVFATGIMAVAGKGSIDAGVAGLAISYALRVTAGLTLMVRQTCDMETYIISVERIQEYTEVEPEADWYNDETRPSPEWPQHGKVEFQDYCTRYRKGLDLVLKGIDVTIKPGEKVGIVGRTGAGKSSLTLALFRLIESASGYIVIDDVEISSLGLHDLRRCLTIIPQDPVLFSGTLRMNLDPFDEHSDDQLWKCLELGHLKGFVQNEPEGFQYECSEGGENLSVGQRQLLCLARALLRKTKILVLDEATAAVDLETDDLIQNTIRTAFADCTVITIAHRLKTILDYDRVMVLDRGIVEEYDSPANLMDNSSSIFYGMAKDAGLVA
ncbi:multidrug resistance-associated protein 1-like isoform X2 [Tubulanus polymorphus]|uniref:multidrug resistance-associated protein 1-like isoform X2 n=1 Tax=Tubulanus polymorphus TaxID=672921 RepID=UPI003DA6123E